MKRAIEIVQEEIDMFKVNLNDAPTMHDAYKNILSIRTLDLIKKKLEKENEKEV